MSPSKAWAEARDLPDPVALADLRSRPSDVEVALSIGDERQLMFTVPWPKPTGGHRQLAVLDPFDEVEMRVLTAHMVVPVDEDLPAFPTVSGHRLAKPPPGWTYHRPKEAYEARRGHLRELVEATDFEALVIADVANCYRSISVERSAESLDRLGVAEACALRVED